MSPTWVSSGEVSHRCECCARPGRYQESTIAVPLVHRATGTERTWSLCPPCLVEPGGTVDSRWLWSAWRRDAVVRR